MSKSGDVNKRIARATRIRTKPSLNWTLIQRWAAFNALYGPEGRGSEEKRLQACIEKYLSNEDAARVLSRNEPDIAVLTKLAPGDMRRGTDDPKFRQRSELHVAAVLDHDLPTTKRVAHLAATMYQVRSNLVHGDKDPQSSRDRRLVSATCRILADLVPVLERAMS